MEVGWAASRSCPVLHFGLGASMRGLGLELGFEA